MQQLHVQNVVKSTLLNVKFAAKLPALSTIVAELHVSKYSPSVTKISTEAPWVTLAVFAAHTGGIVVSGCKAERCGCGAPVKHRFQRIDASGHAQAERRALARGRR